VAIARILVEAGIGDVAVTDRKGIVHAARTDLTDVKRDLAPNAIWPRSPTRVV
jgi:malate dehydrogenase (oxaloacetate-decarboxylating)